MRVNTFSGGSTQFRTGQLRFRPIKGLTNTFYGRISSYLTRGYALSVARRNRSGKPLAKWTLIITHDNSLVLVLKARKCSSNGCVIWTLTMKCTNCWKMWGRISSVLDNGKYYLKIEFDLFKRPKRHDPPLRFVHVGSIYMKDTLSKLGAICET